MVTVLIFFATCLGALAGYFLSIYVLIVATIGVIVGIRNASGEPFPSGGEIIVEILSWFGGAMWIVRIVTLGIEHTPPFPFLSPALSVIKSLLFR